MLRALTLKEVRDIRDEAYIEDKLKKETKTDCASKDKYHLNLADRKLPAPVACFSENDRGAYRKNKTEESQLACHINHLQTQEKVCVSSHNKLMLMAMRKCVSYRTKAIQYRSKSAIKNRKKDKLDVSKPNSVKESSKIPTIVVDDFEEEKEHCKCVPGRKTATPQPFTDTGRPLSRSTIHFRSFSANPAKRRNSPISRGRTPTRTRCKTAWNRSPKKGLYFETAKSPISPPISPGYKSESSVFSFDKQKKEEEEDTDDSDKSSDAESVDFAFDDRAISALTVHRLQPDRSAERSHRNSLVLNTAKAVDDIKRELRELERQRKRWKPQTFNLKKAIKSEKQTQKDCINKIKAFNDNIKQMTHQPYKIWDLKELEKKLNVI